jgi:hypothetical protein
VTSEYDPFFGASSDDGDDPGAGDLAAVRRAFGAAARPYLSSPWVWLVWAALLPGAALATEPVAARHGAPGVLLLWSFTILAGGLVELAGMRSRGAFRKPSGLARWALRGQGNLSLVGVVLSALLLWIGYPEAVAGIWLLLLGHSFFLLGGLSSRPMRTAGVIFQAGGVASLWPGLPALPVFALTAAAGCLWLAVGQARERSRERHQPM